MTTHTTDDRDRLIDRLVDGELTGSERFALLTRLDAEPDGSGWRRCALAFLEAQEWGEALRPVAAEFPPAVLTLPPRTPPPRYRSAVRLAVAAGLLLAFLTGWLARGRDGAHDGPLVASAPIDPPPQKTALPPNALPVALNVPADEPNVDAPDTDTDRDETWPSEVIDGWQRQGYEVERRQRLVSLGNESGQDLTVPVEETRLRYIGDRIY